MKKLYIFLTAALSIAFVSCQKELLEVGPAAEENLRTFTVSFDESSTRTDITTQGKTVWKEGDAIWVTNGEACDTLTVASAYDGQKYCEFTTTLQGKLYVAYPCSAAQGLTADGKIILSVPSVQNGQFGSANISAAVVDGDMKAKMKNVTSVLKFRIPSDVTKQVKVVSINSAGNRAAGTFSVDLATGTPVVATADTVVYSTDISVKVDGLQGNFYATVIPGTYGTGFTMTAVAIDLKNAYQSKTTTSDKTLGPNEMFDLGRIGDELKGLQGDGSKANPWQVGTFPEMLALTYYVNDGNSMRDQYVKLTNDIATVTTPIGIYNGEKDVVNYPFQGDFDGNDKTVTVNMNGSEKPVGLFAYLADSAYVHNVKVAGKVSTTGSIAGSLAGYIYSTTPVTIENCSSSAVMSGGSVIGGLVGQSYGNANKNINNCSFSGTIDAKHTAGGIIAYGYYADIAGCSNSGSITTTETNGGCYYVTKYSGGYSFQELYNRGTGGISGWNQAGSLKDCNNTGSVKAYNKLGGIVGSAYLTSVLACTNSGNVESSDAGVMGGVIGWIMTNGNVYQCVNTGKVVGTAKAGWVGGIVGHSTPEGGKICAVNIYRCENKGEVSSEKGVNVGGVVGYAISISNAPNRTDVSMCNNSGKVSSDTTCVGGIIGYEYDCGSYTSVSVKGNINTGDITASGFVGGILGRYHGTYTKLMVFVDNCENSGAILSTKTSDNDYAGGIVGGCTVTNVSTASGNQYGVNIRNSNNSGTVSYSVATHKVPYVGGILGGIHCAYEGLYNCYNSGEVGLKDGTMDPDAEKYIGAIVGLDNSGTNRFSNCYALEGTATNLAGAASTNNGASVSFVSADGSLKTPVTYKEVEYSNVLDVLNAWVGTSTGYYQWTTGTKLVQPSYTDSLDGSGFDIGNGGQI